MAKRNFFFPLGFSLAVMMGVGLVPDQIPQIATAPVVAQTQQSIDLALTGHLRSVEKNWRGEEKVVWRDLNGGFFRGAPTVRPGDVLRYTINGNNKTEQPVSGLVLTDDLPENTVYVIGSAASVGGASITYSIDGGTTYTTQPTVQVTLPDGTVETRPAPADRYTHVRWTFAGAIPAKSNVSGQYQVRVQ